MSGRGKYERTATVQRTCCICRKTFPAYFHSAETCSPRCRKAKSRQRLPTLTIPGMEVPPDLEVPNRARAKRKKR